MSDTPIFDQVNNDFNARSFDYDAVTSRPKWDIREATQRLVKPRRMPEPSRAHALHLVAEHNARKGKGK